MAGNGQRLALPPGTSKYSNTAYMYTAVFTHPPAFCTLFGCIHTATATVFSHFKVIEFAAPIITNTNVNIVGLNALILTVTFHYLH